MKNIGRARYDEIPVAAGLDQVLQRGMKRAEWERRRKSVIQWTASVAAVFCIFFACANVTPIYAYAVELPVIGSLVRVLHIGTGGELTDGAHITADGHGETIDFHFTGSRQELDAAPVYTAAHQLAPNRLILDIYGVRSMDAAAIFDDLLAADAVRDAYPSMIGDDSAYGFVIVLNSGYTYEITEYENPAALAVRFYRDESYQPGETVYYLRTEAMPYGEELGMTAEKFDLENVTQLRTESGDYIVVVGQYTTEAEAAAALQELEDKHGGETGLFIASGTADMIPEK